MSKYSIEDRTFVDSTDGCEYDTTFSINGHAWDRTTNREEYLPVSREQLYKSLDKMFFGIRQLADGEFPEEKEAVFLRDRENDVCIIVKDAAWNADYSRMWFEVKTVIGSGDAYMTRRRTTQEVIG